MYLLELAILAARFMYQIPMFTHTLAISNTASFCTLEYKYLSIFVVLNYELKYY